MTHTNGAKKGIPFAKVHQRVIKGMELEVLVGGVSKDKVVAQLSLRDPPTHFRVLEPEWLKSRTQGIRYLKDPEKSVREYVEEKAKERYGQRKILGLLPGPRVEVKYH